MLWGFQVTFPHSSSSLFDHEMEKKLKGL